MVSEVKGASIKFKSYEESVPKLLGILKLQREIKKYDKIVLKVSLTDPLHDSTRKEFVESILKFVLEHKNPVADVFIAEGADGVDTQELFEALGYDALAEKYDVSLIDLNKAEVEVVENYEFLKFDEVYYPKLLLESFVISLPRLRMDEETEIAGVLSNMLGAFPADHYKGFFSRSKNKIRKWPMRYSVHDIIKCKIPDFAIVDAAEQNVILAGLPLEIDKQAAKLLGKEWKEVPYLRLIDESLSEKKDRNEDIDYV
ncbi:MAG: DUF362 domain-containing protein [Nanoarchaeota archaeon]|nr:DUF362 domain-containing protein [Nanoarchaeota archaeon]MBU0977908.1 DUF362 domain-containing protein [Nanoarchaeota archaeon]